MKEMGADLAAWQERKRQALAVIAQGQTRAASGAISSYPGVCIGRKERRRALFAKAASLLTSTCQYSPTLPRAR
jgi:hypothetical protein